MTANNSAGMPELPPVPSRAYLCFTRSDPDWGWRFLNSLFDLPPGCNGVRMWLRVPGYPECDFYFHAMGSWDVLVRKVTEVPQLSAALQRNLLWTVFGKSNLVDPMFVWAWRRDFVKHKPCTEDILDNLFPNIYPTAENRGSFNRGFCEWIVGNELPTPLHFLKC